MNRFAECVIVILVCILSGALPISLLHHRSRRFLTFPRQQPTCIAFIAGIGIPVDLEYPESVTIGYVFKMQFYLPENASNFLNAINDPFDITTQPITGIVEDRRRRSIEGPASLEQSDGSASKGYDYEQNERFERYKVDAQVIERGTESTNKETEEIIDNGLWIDSIGNNDNSDPNAVKGSQYLGSSRFSLYKGIVAVAESKGLSGKACMLRSICESAHTTFDSNDILGEMMHVIMTPSSTQDVVSDYTDYEYYRAERLGKDGAPCEHIFNDCKMSILDLFTGIYSPVEELFSRILA